MRNDFYVGCYEDPSHLAHFGIKDMKWYVRRYQNPDGSLTELGRQHYGVGAKRVKKAEGAANVYKARALKANIKQTKLKTKDLKKYGEISEKTSRKVERLKDKEARNEAKYHKKLAVAEAKKFKLQEEMVNVDGATKLSMLGNLTGKGEAKIQKLLAKEEIANRRLEKAEELSKQTNKALDEYDIDKAAHDAAKKAGLDQGDNYKVYAKAQAGDKQAQEIVKRWETYGAHSSNDNAISQATVSTIKSEKQSIAKDMASEMLADLKRWESNGDAKMPSVFNGKSDSEIKKIISDKIEKNISKVDEYYAFKDGTINFGIDGIDGYSDYAPLTVEYDLKNKKIKNFYYT